MILEIELPLLYNTDISIISKIKQIPALENITFLGIINEELTKVGRTYIGLVFKLQIKGKSLPAKSYITYNGCTNMKYLRNINLKCGAKWHYLWT